MSDNGIVWEDPPDVKRHNSKGREKYRLFFDALRQNPGRWALHPKMYSDSGSADAVKRNFRRTYGSGFEYTARKDEETGGSRLYVRYVGTDA